MRRSGIIFQPAAGHARFPETAAARSGTPGTKQYDELPAAVITVDLAYNEISGDGKSMLFLVASGTACRLSAISRGYRIPSTLVPSSSLTGPQ